MNDRTCLTCVKFRGRRRTSRSSPRSRVAGAAGVREEGRWTPDQVRGSAQEKARKLTILALRQGRNTPPRCPEARAQGSGLEPEGSRPGRDGQIDPGSSPGFGAMRAPKSRAGGVAASLTDEILLWKSYFGGGSAREGPSLRTLNSLSRSEARSLVSHSQMVITCHPRSRSSAVFLRSRSTFLPSFGIQYSPRDLGMLDRRQSKC
jgi:hypothetical protein